MKKTLFAFSVTVVISIAVFLAIGLSGCEWFDTKILGKQSKEELAEKDLKMQSELEKIDSIRNESVAKLEDLSAKRADMEENANNGENKAYHVIMSCYEEQANVTYMMNVLKNNGYTPYTLPMGSLTAVAAGGYDTEQQAITEKNRIEEKDFFDELEIEDDIWIYKKP